jgi:iron complex outermembrane receptor protein
VRPSPPAAPVAVALGALVVLAAPAPRAEERYETVVRGQLVEELAPDGDPVGFGSRLRLSDPSLAADLARLLERAPGLRVREAGPAGRQTLSLRGADSQQVAVFLDGIRLTPPAGGGVDLSLYDPGHLEEAEVRRGGGSTRLGAGAIGGALLLRTPRLRDRALTTASLGYGSYRSLAFRAARGAPLGRLRYLVSASYRQAEGDFPYLDHNGVPQRRLNNDSRQGEAILKLDTLAGRWHLLLLDDLALAERGAPGMSQRPSLTARQRDLRNLTGVAASRHGTLLAGGRLDLQLSHRYERFAFDEPAPPVVHSENQSFSLEGRAALGLPLGRDGRVDGSVELRGTFFREREAGDPSRLEADLALASRTWLGGRLLLVAPAVRVALATGFDATVAPRLGLVARPLARARPALAALELAGSVGRSFRYPSFHELYVRYDGFGGNAALRPEDSLDGDLGLRWRHRGVAFEAAYFRRQLKNLILFAPVSSFLVRADNYGAAVADGAELAARAELPAGLALRASYTLTRTRFGAPAMSLPGHPTHRVKGRVDWELPFFRSASSARRVAVRVFSGVTAESAMVLGRFDGTPEEGRVLLAAGAAVSYRGLTLSAEGENLLDKRDAVDSVGFPLPPARIFVSLSARHASELR